MIQFDNVQVILGESPILRGISLDVDTGRFVALVGPNGAGKTTVLRTINGLITPSDGRVIIDGRDIVNLSARAISRLVATVPQETTLGFDFDVESIVAMGRTPHRGRFSTTTQADRDAVDAALHRTDTARFADRSVGTLSGGERQRVLLARALAQRTPILLLDEPTASLDLNHQIRTLSMARSLANEGKTVVAAIHDLELAARFCDAVVLLNDGEVVATGSPDAVFTAERLEMVFDVRTAVGTDHATGTPTVTPLTMAPQSEARVHVIGRGERTARVVGRLVEAGFDVSIGIIPDGDVAEQTARSLGSTVVSAPPFDPVDETTRQRALDLCDGAGVTVIASTPEGPNRHIVAHTEPRVALPGIASGVDAPVVPETDLVEALQEHAALEEPRP